MAWKGPFCKKEAGNWQFFLKRGREWCIKNSFKVWLDLYLITWKTDKAENKQTNVLIFYTSWTLGAPELLSGITLGSDHQLVCCAMPWAVSSSLDDDKLFLDPRTTSILSSWFYLIWYYYLSVKFVMWIVKQKIENKRNLF